MSYFCIFLFLVLTLFKSGNFQSSPFTCTPFQGYLEDNYTFGKEKVCPTEKCLTFYVYCEDYWTTQCYDPTKPMGVINDYKAAKSYFANSKKYWYLMTCGKDGRCTDIGSDPISFDYQLWPKVKKPAARVVENTMTFYDLEEGENIEMVGQIQKGATQIWIRLDLMNPKGAFKKYKFVFGIPKQQYRLDGKKWKSAKSWSTKLTPGSNLTVSIQSTKSSFDVFANGNNLGVTISKSNGFLDFVKFGGKWNPKKFSKHDKSGDKAVFFAPKFSAFQPTNLNVACKPNTIQPASTIKYKDISKQLSSSKGSVPIALSRNNMIGYGHETIELRKSLCQNSDIAYIEIGSWKQGKSAPFRIYIEMWSRRSNQWNDMKMANIDAAQCKTYQITVDDYDVNFLCDNSTLVSLEYRYAKTSIAYLVEQKERENVCNK